MPVRGIRSDTIKKKNGVLDYEDIIEELSSRHWPLLNGFPHQKLIEFINIMYKHFHPDKATTATLNETQAAKAVPEKKLSAEALDTSSGASKRHSRDRRDEDLRKIKDEMNIQFEKNKIAKTSDKFEYDVKKDFGPATEPSDWDSDEDSSSKKTKLKEPTKGDSKTSTLSNEMKSKKVKTRKDELDEIDSLLDSFESSKVSSAKPKSSDTPKESSSLDSKVVETKKDDYLRDGKISQQTQKEESKAVDLKSKASSIPVPTSLSSLSGLPSLNGSHLGNLPPLHGLNKVLAPLSKEKENPSPRNSIEKREMEKSPISPKLKDETKSETVEIPKHTEVKEKPKDISKVEQPHSINAPSVPNPVMQSKHQNAVPLSKSDKKGGLGSEIIDDISEDIEEEILINSDEDEEFSKLKVQTNKIKKDDQIPAIAKSTSSIIPISPLSPLMVKEDTPLKENSSKSEHRASLTDPSKLQISPISPKNLIPNTDKTESAAKFDLKPVQAGQLKDKPIDLAAKKNSLLGDLPSLGGAPFTKKVTAEAIKKESNYGYEVDFGAGETDSEDIVFSDDGLPIDDANDAF
ncbi:hypothetical protein HDV04_003475 [Boothiomyces sp. JEL0838]|nr:hypothetical protein HDV04_003475 [Boothiomyces sp. JEL0838]